jgi:CheY-like chemotaxis protein
MSGKSEQILVLDDESVYAEMLCKLLGEEGFVTTMFTSPADALKWLDDNQCSLVVTDYMMPGANGSEVLRQIREGHPDLPVIIISGLMNTRDLINVANQDVNMVLEKPIDRKVLIDNIRRYVQPRNAHAPAQRTQPAVKVAPVAHKNKVTPYPAENLRSSSASAGSRKFLQNLWEAFNSSGGATLALPLGGELELIVSDLEHWFALEPPAVRLSPTMMKLDGKSLAETKVLTIFDARYAMNDLSDTVTTLRKEMPKGQLLLILQRSDNAKPIADLPLVALPPFSSRMADIAAYSRAILERIATGNVLSSEAARLILNYPWPGNYYELMGALRRAVLSIDGELIDAKTLSTAIASGHGAAQNKASEMTMETYLASQQAEWFERHECPDLSSAAKAAKLPQNAFDPNVSVSLQPLLFRDILTK